MTKIEQIEDLRIWIKRKEFRIAQDMQFIEDAKKRIKKILSEIDNEKIHEAKQTKQI